jgi:hypothetical protein
MVQNRMRDMRARRLLLGAIVIAALGTDGGSLAAPAIPPASDFSARVDIPERSRVINCPA